MKQDPTYEDVRALVLSELDTALSAIDPQSVEQLMEAVLSSRKVFFVGVGRVLLSLEAMAKRWLELTRSTAFAAGPALGGAVVGWAGAAPAYALAADAIIEYITNGVESAMCKYNTKKTKKPPEPAEGADA